MEQFITVARIQAPGPGKKQYAIYDTSDKRWGVSAQDANDFAVGNTYKIWDWQTSMFNNRQYDTIKSGNYQMTSGMNNAPGSAPPRPQAPPNRGFVAPDDVTRRRDIFVCGALNNILNGSAGAVNENGVPLWQNGQELTKLVWRLRKVFDYSLGPAAQDPSFSTAPTGRGATPAQQAEASMGYPRVDGEPPKGNRHDMDDEIPF